MKPRLIALLLLILLTLGLAIAPATIAPVCAEECTIIRVPDVNGPDKRCMLCDGRVRSCN